MNTVIIPTKNEPGISKVIELTKTTVPNAEIIVVDKSTDNTPNIARKAGAKIIYQKGNGYGSAYITGFNQAKGDNILMIDGDMSYDPRDFKRMLKPITNDEADLVLGNRFAGLKKGSMSYTNKIGNKFLTRLLNKLYKIDIQDSQSGMRIITKKALDKLDMQETGMPLASEMLIEAVKKGLRIAEVPISYNPRIGKAKQNVYNGLKIASTTVRLIRDYNPLTTFSIIALTMILPGVLVGIDVVVQWITQGVITRIASVVLSSMLILTGVFTFLIGLMIDLIVKEVRKK